MNTYQYILSTATPEDIAIIILLLGGLVLIGAGFYHYLITRRVQEINREENEEKE